MSQTALEALDAKITLILEQYNSLKDENILLQEELITAKQLLEERTNEVTKLKEEDELKDLELEEIASKISQMMKLD